MSLIVLAGQIWIGSMFVYSAALKLASYDQLTAMVAAYAVLPSRVGVAAARLLPWLEGAVGAMLLIGVSSNSNWPRLVGAGGAFVLATAFTFAAVNVLKSGRAAAVPCGCTGHASDTVSSITLARVCCVAVTSVFIIAERNVSAGLPWGVIAVIAVVAAFPGGLALSVGWSVNRDQSSGGQSRHLSPEVPGVD